MSRKIDEYYVDEMGQENVAKIKENQGKWCCWHGVFSKICCKQSKNTLLCCVKNKNNDDYIKVTTDDIEESDDDGNIGHKSGTTSKHISCSNELPYIRTNDPFIVRDINTELRDTLQTFNLMIYGEPLIACIMNQIQKQNRDA